MLTSSKNPTIQHIRKLQAQARYRRETGLFVIEGARLVAECLAAGVLPETLLYTESLASDLPQAFRAKGVAPVLVSDPVMQAAGDTRSPQGILAAVPQSTYAVPEKVSFAVVLDGVRDPGNVGTILRTASAAGADVVLLAPGCADPFSPKVVRAGMGIDNFTSRFTHTDVFRKIMKLDYIQLRYTPNNRLGVRYEPWHIKVIA